MDSRSIDEVYQKNNDVADRLEALVGSLDKEQIDVLPKGEKWTIGNIVEHVSIVEAGVIRICGKLLRKAESEHKAADGTISVSDSFMEKTLEIARLKLEAPEIVQPQKRQAVLRPSRCTRLGLHSTPVIRSGQGVGAELGCPG